jgi:hypothetical protein
MATHPSPNRARAASTALLVVGYALAAGAGAKIVPAWRERRGGRVAAFETGTACVTAGLALRRKWFLVAANAITFVAVGLAWFVTGSRER